MVRSNFNLGGSAFTLSASCMGVVTDAFGEKSMPRKKYRITVNTDSGKTSFTFFDSVHNYWNGAKLNASWLLGALECFLSNALCYDNSYNFIEFCDELGYDTDSRKALRIYNGCKRHAIAAGRVFGDNYADILNEINA